MAFVNRCRRPVFPEKAINLYVASVDYQQNPACGQVDTSNDSHERGMYELPLYCARKLLGGQYLTPATTAKVGAHESATWMGNRFRSVSGNPERITLPKT
jgi:hypothetical protein